METELRLKPSCLGYTAEILSLSMSDRISESPIKVTGCTPNASKVLGTEQTHQIICVINKSLHLHRVVRAKAENKGPIARRAEEMTASKRSPEYVIHALLERRPALSKGRG